jgi:cysteine-S-conjugate beta-lyase
MYGPTRDAALKLLTDLGVRVAFYDPLAGAGIARALQRRTRLVWLESPGTLSMEMQEVAAIAAAAKKAGAATAMDNTWATPLFLRPLQLGVDYSVQALTKFIGGHSDLLMGAVAVSDERAFRRLRDVQGLLGCAVSADDCYLAMRGLDTLPVRLERQARSALDLARWLVSQPQVAEVLHPGLESDPGHAAWRRDCAGAGAVFTVLLQDRSWCACRAFADALRLFRLGASWGGVQSLVAVYPQPPGRRWPRLRPGAVVRLAIGLEEPADLKADLARALLNVKRRSR